MPLLYGDLTSTTVHLCVDMQNLLGPGSPWHAPWASRVLPVIVQLVEWCPAATIFTRFVPPPETLSLPPPWRRYYEDWRELRRDQIDPRLLELLAPLACFTPPATLLDKPVYSPFSGRRLGALLRARRADALVISGAETDVCVLATVLGAVDHGFRTVVVEDGLCSSNDQTHHAAVSFYRSRLKHQVEIATAAEVLEAWAPV